MSVPNLASSHTTPGKKTFVDDVKARLLREWDVLDRRHSVVCLRKLHAPPATIQAYNEPRIDVIVCPIPTTCVADSFSTLPTYTSAEAIRASRYNAAPALRFCRETGSHPVS